MRSLIIAGVLFLGLCSTASAQCAGGSCARGGLRSVLLRPVRVATAPVRVVRERQVVRSTVRVVGSVRPVRGLFKSRPIRGLLGGVCRRGRCG